MSAMLAIPTGAWAAMPHDGGGAGTGGGGLGGGTTAAPVSTSPALTAPAATPSRGVIKLGGLINASGDGITLTVAAAGTLGQPLTISGEAPATDAGLSIDVESARLHTVGWTTVARATVAPDGRFSTQWTPEANGQVQLRAMLAPSASTPAPNGAGSSTAPGAATSTGAAGIAGSGSAAAATTELSTSPLTIPIFRSTLATLYGPGFWGRHTACGERLTRATLGVASRTLKCGTRVAVLYEGRELVVPVIDRGPFANGATWDLTMATAHVLGIRQTTRIGTLISGPGTPSLRPAPASGS
jgi:rare lipoprotein A